MSKTPAILWLDQSADISALNNIAEQAHWKLVDDVVRRHAVPTSRRWETSDGITITWVEDHTLGIRFVHVSDTSVLTVISGKLPHRTREDALREARSKPLEEALDALRLLTRIELGRGLSDELATLLRGGLKHPNRIVKRAVVRLVMTGAWEELRPDLEAAQKRDPELADLWSLALGALDRARASRMN